MAEPWFDPQTFGAWYGSLVGGLGGSAFGLVLGAVPYPTRTAGQRAVVRVALVIFSVVGLGSLAAGAVGWWAGQPGAVAWPLALVGLIFVPIAFAVGARRWGGHQPSGAAPDAEPSAAADPAGM